MFTGAVPFSDSTSMMAMLFITEEKRPPRPALPSFTPDLWTLTQRCWSHDPLSRPKISEIVTQLLTLSIHDRLIGRAPAAHKRISPIVTVFLGNGQVEAIQPLSQDDTQILIDVVDQVIPYAIPCSMDGLADYVPNLHISSIRCWMTMAFRQRSAGSICPTCTGLAVVEPCFLGRLKSRFAMTRTRSHCATMNLGMCGRDGTMVGRLQPRF